MEKVYTFGKLDESLRRAVLSPGGLAVALFLWAVGMMSATTKSLTNDISTQSNWSMPLPIVLILVMFGLYFAVNGNLSPIRQSGTIVVP